MASDVAYMEKRVGGLTMFKKAPIGFSWTMLFFGFIVPLLRGHWKIAAIMFGLSVLFGAAGVPPLSSLMNLVFAFFYNRIYQDDLFKEGYVVKGFKYGAKPAV